MFYFPAKTIYLPHSKTSVFILGKVKFIKHPQTFWLVKMQNAAYISNYISSNWKISSCNSFQIMKMLNYNFLLWKGLHQKPWPTCYSPVLLLYCKANIVNYYTNMKWTLNAGHNECQIKIIFNIVKQDTTVHFQNTCLCVRPHIIES